MGGTKIAAVILAAGYSGRMGRFKPLLDLGGCPVIERTITLFKEALISDVRVVVGYNKELLVPILNKLKVQIVVNGRYSEGMFSSVQVGVSSLDRDVEAFFVLPVDVPLVSPATVRLLVESFRANPGKILVPSFDGRGGHPPLIASKYKKCIINYEGGEGLKGALQQVEAAIIRVPVRDENILFDIDSPGDCDELQQRWKRRHEAGKSDETANTGAMR